MIYVRIYLGVGRHASPIRVMGQREPPISQNHWTSWGQFPDLMICIVLMV